VDEKKPAINQTKPELLSALVLFCKKKALQNATLSMYFILT